MPNTMKAAVYRRYGPPEVIQVIDWPTPIPKDHEVLIRVRASTVSSADWRMRTLSVPKGFGFFARPAFGFFGPRKPILGLELAGEVVEVGPKVTQFKVGDRVFAFPGIGLGGHAQYRAMPEDGKLVLMPRNLTFEQAAALSFGGSTARHFLRDLGKIAQGEEVLIVGASGSVGSAAVQIAKHFGATVTGVTSTANCEVVTTLGAHHVVDYTAQDIFKIQKKYDVIFDTVGTSMFSDWQHALNDGGRMLMAAASVPQMIQSAWAARKTTKQSLIGTTPENVEQLRDLKALAESGAFLPLIDRTYPLAQIAQAHAAVETRHKRGNIVVTME